MRDISRLISDVFGQLEGSGIDTSAIWAQIDNAVVLSILSGIGHLEKSEKVIPPHSMYSRCFHLLGFDILLDRNLKAHVLEVNYRPSLDFYRPAERRMKVGMLTDLLRIAVPFNGLQEVINSRGWGWMSASWTSYLKEHPELVIDGNERRRRAAEEGQFVQAWPSTNDVHLQVFELARELAKQPIPPTLLGGSALGGSQEEA
jgi:hypothetical protein